MPYGDHDSETTNQRAFPDGSRKKKKKNNSKERASAFEEAVLALSREWALKPEMVENTQRKTGAVIILMVHLAQRGAPEITSAHHLLLGPEA